MSRSKEADETLLIAAPKTNRLFVILCAVALVAFLGNLGVFTWQLIRGNEVDQRICATANENREVLRNVISQSYRASEKGQLIPVQIRDIDAPQQPTALTLLYVPPSTQAAKTKDALISLTDPINCERVSSGL